MVLLIIGVIFLLAHYLINRWEEQSNFETTGKRVPNEKDPIMDTFDDLGGLYFGLLGIISGLNELLKPYIHEALLHLIIGILSLIAGRIIKKRVQYFAEDNFDIFLGKFPEYVAYIVALFNFLDVIF